MTHEEATALYNRWAEAAVADDFATLESQVSDRFEVRGEDGSVQENRDEFLSFFRNGKDAANKMVDYSIELLDLTEEPIALVRETVVFKRPDGSTYTIEVQTQDGWGFIDGRWQLTWTVVKSRTKR